MSKFTDDVKSSANDLEQAEKSYEAAKIRLSTVRGHCGQSGYSVTVNGVTVAVSTCDSRTYQGTLIRGREMIHLGALKALGAELQFAADRVKKCREILLSLVSAP